MDVCDTLAIVLSVKDDTQGCQNERVLFYRVSRFMSNYNVYERVCPFLHEIFIRISLPELLQRVFNLDR